MIRAESGLDFALRSKNLVPLRQGPLVNGATSLKYILVIVTALSLSCKEPLPTYKDPSEVFSGVLRIGYLYGTPPANIFSVQLVIVNDFDETFEGRTLFEGTIEIVLARKPDVKKTFFLSVENLIQGRYNAGSRVLTFNPRDSVRLGIYWGFIDDQGVDLRETEFTYSTDRACPRRKIARQETFLVSGTLKLYDRTGEIKFGPVVFPLCYVLNPRVEGCVTIWGEEACGSAW